MALACLHRVCYKISVKLISNPRNYATDACKVKKGLVVGAYTGCTDESVVLTPAARVLDSESNGRLLDCLKIAGPGLGKGKSHIFYRLHDEHDIIAVVGLGKETLGYNVLEEVDERKEAVRTAAAVGCRALQDIGCTDVFLENLGDAEASAEGGTLGVWCYQENRNEKKKKKIPEIFPHEGESTGWSNGIIVAKAQNIARRLADTPSNLMTPSIFANEAENVLSKWGVDVSIRGKSWAEEMKMGAFLSVAKGSAEPPIFLEMSYKGAGDSSTNKPIVLVGKGVTFDSGGISLKPSANMDHMRADMQGAACVVATLNAISQLRLRVNVVGLIPLCENMPSGKSVKPGDVVRAMNGKTICVDNTDAEGRLILADALCYADTLKPLFTLDIATLTGAMNVALGPTATGVFSNSTAMWQRINKAGVLTGDRVWRFPLWNEYSKAVTEYTSVDVNNVSKMKGGGACTAAAFLKEFVPPGDWLHLDIAPVMGPESSCAYLQKGMTGRPTRTLVHLISQYCPLP